MNTPAISVVMSVYKEPEEWFRQSIGSILGQTFTDFEFIIINDYPERADNHRILAEYARQDSRIRVLENDQNRGLIYSLNRGLDVAQGKYIARMDADDMSLSERFEKQYAYMEAHPECVVCGTQIAEFGDAAIQHHKYNASDYDIRAHMLYTTGVAHPSVFIKNQMLQESGLRYDERYPYAEDYQMWYALSHLGTFHNLNEIGLRYRISHQQTSRAKKLLQQKTAQSVRLLFIRDWLRSLDCGSFEYSAELSAKQALTPILDKVSFTDSFYQYYIKTVYLTHRSNQLKNFYYGLISGDFFRLGLCERLCLIKHLFA
ncbi:MAG: glycosyltransferase [Bacteroidales bacterium]|nr:glycosyltransferase [Bacteroidales bacterium]